MREIVLDTETTGRDPRGGDRVVEIGCLELDNHIPTGKVYQTYLNPERDVPEEVVRIHGLTEDFLRDHPRFDEVAGDFLDFIGDARLIIHNAPFDMGFLNAELENVGRKALSHDRVLDTLEMARKKFPGARNSLDALCRRFGVDNSARSNHGAVLDSELLAEVYLELIGGRQQDLALAVAARSAVTEASHAGPARAHEATAREREAHKAFIETLDNPIWKR